MTYGFTPHGLLVIVIVGVIAGWIAGRVMRGGGFGLVGNLVVGILGAVIGSQLFAFLGVHAAHGYLGLILMSSVGSIILLFVIGLLQK